MAPPQAKAPTPSTPTTPPLSLPFSPSTTGTTSSSASSGQDAPTRPALRARSSVPFSWEAQPGVPKHAADDPQGSRATGSAKPHQAPSARTPLRPPPTLRTNSDPFPALRRRGTTRSPRMAAPGGAASNDPVFVRDPFAVALAECCAERDRGLDGDDDRRHDDAPAARGARGSQRWAAEYYCSPPDKPDGSRRWGAEYYCSPPRAHAKVSGGRGRGGRLLGSVFGFRSLGLYASCKAASAVADSIAYLPSSSRPRPRSRSASSARVRSAGSPRTKTGATAAASMLFRSDSIDRNRLRRTW